MLPTPNNKKPKTIISCPQANKQSSAAFTLIELLVVISIIGLLASVVVTSLGSARAKARDARRIEDLKQIQIALELYFSDNNQYPESSFSSDHRVCLSAGQEDCWNGLLPTEYISRMPRDPLNKDAGAACSGADGSRLYMYSSDSTNQKYILATNMENVSTLDPHYYDYTTMGGHPCLQFANWAIQGGS